MISKMWWRQNSGSSLLSSPHWVTEQGQQELHHPSNPFQVCTRVVQVFSLLRGSDLEAALPCLSHSRFVSRMSECGLTFGAKYRGCLCVTMTIVWWYKILPVLCCILKCLRCLSQCKSDGLEGQQNLVARAYFPSRKLGGTQNGFDSDTFVLLVPFLCVC